MSQVPPMDGLYNIPRGRDEVYTYYQTVARLPSMRTFYKEREGIARRLEKVIRQYLKGKEIPVYNEILEAVFGDYAVGKFPSDRTLCFFVGNLTAFTPDFFRTLQEQVLMKYPLWRLLAQFEEKQVGIYPEAVWLGDILLEEAFGPRHKAYLAWWKDAEEYRERRFGSLHRQLAHVRRLIPAAMPRAQDNKLAALAAFDCYQPHFPGHALWFLQAVEPDRVSLATESAPIRTSAVSQDGDIYPQFCKEFTPYSARVPPYWVTTYLLEAAKRHAVAVKEKGKGIVGRITIEEVIHDEDLKKLKR